jgi:phosphoribosylformimino-5-aminoimidazole carboxamide ribotide isomerase
MEEETVFSDIPEQVAVQWYEMGAERLHMVDLDGAIQGRPVNRETIKRVVDAIPIPVQLGGGIRDMPTLGAYFDLGLQYVILGTAAHKDPDFAQAACARFPDQIIIGVDARGDRVAVEGWTEESSTTALELSQKFEDSGASAIVYTDIFRDGMRTGPNLEATKSLAQAVNLPVIASGGISGLEDVLSILPLSAAGVMGMITGRALYDGSLDLRQALRAVREHG